ncbi:hypothetical protein [Crocosphaera sp.]|uniref:hypothetical protein n=1 Tax=Crocosphaera sp. TaxID=2729996 RepID=UPI003F270C6A|nr:hypothetical protein [Crocosphaera sp.]
MQNINHEIPPTNRQKQGNSKIIVLIGIYLSSLAFALTLLLIFAKMPLEVQQVLVILIAFLILMSFASFKQIINPATKKTFLDKFQTHFDNRVITYNNSHYYENQNLYYSQHKNIVEAATQIQQLLEQLSENYSVVNEQDKVIEANWVETIEDIEESRHQKLTDKERIIVAKVMTEIENNNPFKDRLLKALKAGGVAAFKELVRHPLTGFVFAAIETWQENELNDIAKTGINYNKEE